MKLVVATLVDLSEVTFEDFDLYINWSKKVQIIQIKRIFNMRNKSNDITGTQAYHF